MSELPKIKPLSKRETAWIKRFQKTMDACPTKRMGFYTTGDCDVTVYDNRFVDHILKFQESAGGGQEFSNGVEEFGAYLGRVDFPYNVESTAG